MKRTLPVAGREAFNLIEMMFIVAIMALLAVLLTAGVKSAIRRGQSGVCCSKMLAIYTAMIAYCDDHNQYVVQWYTDDPDYPIDPTGNGPNASWYTLLMDGNYLSSLEDFKCPANHNGYDPDPNVSPGPTPYYNGSTNYMYDSASGTTKQKAATSLAKLSTIRGLSRKALLFEGGPYPPYGPPSTYHCTYVVSPQPTDLFFNPSAADYCISNAHGSYSNVLFWDGHLEAIPTGQIDYHVADWLNQYP